MQQGYELFTCYILYIYCEYFPQYLVFPPLILFIGFFLIQMNFKRYIVKKRKKKNLSVITFVFLQSIQEISFHFKIIKMVIHFSNMVTFVIFKYLNHLELILHPLRLQLCVCVCVYILFLQNGSQQFQHHLLKDAYLTQSFVCFLGDSKIHYELDLPGLPGGRLTPSHQSGDGVQQEAQLHQTVQSR